MWTASSAGWLVLGYVTGVELALVCGLACGLMACIWHGIDW